MSKPIIISLVIAGSLIILHCAKPNRPEEPPYFVKTPMPDANAELLALTLSGEILAPLNLYERIHRDLEQIRCNNPHHYRGFCNILHTPKFGNPSTLPFYINQEVYDLLTADDYHEWDTLNTRFDFAWYRVYSSDTNIVILYLGGRRNLELIAQEYLSLPGFIKRITIPPPYSMANIYPRMAADTISYLFRRVNTDCSSGIKWSYFWYFSATKDSVSFVGYWMPDWSDPDFPQWWSDAGLNWDDYYGYPFRGVE